MSDLKILLDRIEKLNISKVDLSNYLQVSRQMVYNYLSMNSFDEWPIKKRIMILDLFEVNNYDEIEELEISTNLLEKISMKLNVDDSMEMFRAYKELDEESKKIVNDIVKLCEDSDTRNSVDILLTLVEQSMISKDYKFLILYLSKIFNRIDPRSFEDDPDTQKAFEGILFSAFNLFNSGKYSKDKTTRVHEQFVKELENKAKVDIDVSNTMNLAKSQAKNELGIDKIDESNIDIVLEKMLEIQGRKL